MTRTIEDHGSDYVIAQERILREIGNNDKHYYPSSMLSCSP